MNKENSTESCNAATGAALYKMAGTTALLFFLLSWSHPALSQKTSFQQLPRFVSLKSDKVNVRTGPSIEHPISWVFTRISLPVEVTAHHQKWRRIRDSSGAEGWIYYRLLSGRRTGQITPWKKKKPGSTPLFGSASTSSHVIANLESGVLVDLEECNGNWCKVHVANYTGWIEQQNLWGVYQGETYKN